MKRYSKILFICMPWASPMLPQFGISVLIGKLKKLNYNAQAFYFNMTLAKKIGYSKYEVFSSERDWYAVSEYIFSSLYFDFKPKQDIFFYKEILGEDYIIQNPSVVSDLFNLRNSIIPKFLNDCLERVLSSGEEIIGLSSTFNQIFPSLLLAKKIKERDKSKIILIGGANFHGEMGIEYSKKFSDVLDYVFTGEADNSLIQFLEYLNGSIPIDVIDGLARNGSQSAQPKPIYNMSQVAVPDYVDYFRDIKFTFPNDYQKIVDGITFEGSRGCWWGEKQHCTFCGLNSVGMKFREKTEDNIIEEILFLSEKYQSVSFFAVDNIISIKAFKGLLKRIEHLQLHINFFYEIKSNLSRRDVYTLYCANVRRIQPGIESFSTKTLKLMKKGVSALQNVQLLKFTNEYKIYTAYGILCGFPGETDACYMDNSYVIDRIEHLQPPSGVSKVELHRFSPMHFEKDLYGLHDLKPNNYYTHFFPKDFINIEKIAYFFESETRIISKAIDSLSIQVKKWKTEIGALKVIEIAANFIQVTKIKNGTIIERVALDMLDSLIMIQCDEVTHVNKILAEFEGILPREELMKRLMKLIDNKYIIHEDDKFLNVIPFAIPTKPEAIEKWLLTVKEEAKKIVKINF